jgi:hypothetical protein
VPPGALLAGVVQESLRDALPDRVPPIEAHRVGGLNFHGVFAAAAGAEEMEDVAPESTRTIEIDEFVDRNEIDPRYLIRPYYLRPDGKVGHDVFAVVHETIRAMNKVAIGRVVLTNREHIIALEPLDKG